MLATKSLKNDIFGKTLQKNLITVRAFMDKVKSL